jgi:putative transposase
MQSSAEIDWVSQRHLRFLEDSLRFAHPAVAPEVATAIRARVMSKPALTLLDLLEALQAGTADDVYALIATEHVDVDRSHTPLADPQQVQVFVDREQATAYTTLSQSAWHLFPGSATHSLLSGTLLWWDGKPWRLLNLGEPAVTLLSPQRHLLDRTVEVFDDLLRPRKVTGDTPLPGDSLPTAEQELLQQASPEELASATYRYKLLGRALPAETVGAARTDASLAHQVSDGCSHLRPWVRWSHPATQPARKSSVTSRSKRRALA